MLAGASTQPQLLLPAVNGCWPGGGGYLPTTKHLLQHCCILLGSRPLCLLLSLA